jgi:hypothetical protein
MPILMKFMGLNPEEMGPMASASLRLDRAEESTGALCLPKSTATLLKRLRRAIDE